MTTPLTAITFAGPSAAATSARPAARRPIATVAFGSDSVRFGKTSAPHAAKEKLDNALKQLPVVITAWTTVADKRTGVLKATDDKVDEAVKGYFEALQASKKASLELMSPGLVQLQEEHAKTVASLQDAEAKVSTAKTAFDAETDDTKKQPLQKALEEATAEKDRAKQAVIDITEKIERIEQEEPDLKLLGSDLSAYFANHPDQVASLKASLPDSIKQLQKLASRIHSFTSEDHDKVVQRVQAYIDKQAKADQSALEGLQKSFETIRKLAPQVLLGAPFMGALIPLALDFLAGVKSTASPKPPEKKEEKKEEDPKWSTGKKVSVIGGLVVAAASAVLGIATLGLASPIAIAGISIGLAVALIAWLWPSDKDDKKEENKDPKKS